MNHIIRSISLNMLITGLTLSFFAVLMEVGFLLWAPQIPITSPTMYAPHREILYRPNPANSWPYRTNEFDTMITFNSHGFRGGERPMEKPVNTFRILCLGDSFTLGSEVADEACYPRVLERLLNKQARGNGDTVQYEVLNAGVGGYGTFQELLYFKEFAVKHKPDLVLLQFYSNDVRDNIKFQRHWQALYPDSTLTVSMNNPVKTNVSPVLMAAIQFAGIGGNLIDSLRPIQTFLRENSHLYHFLNTRINILISVLGYRPLTAFDDFLIVMSDYTPETEAGWTLTKSLTLMIRSLAEQSQADFAMTIVPNKAQVANNWRYDQWIEDNQLDFQKPIRILQEFGREQPFPVHDFLPDLKEASTQQPEPLYYNWDGHWNTHGNQLAAQSLFNFLIDQGLVPLARSNP
jgi:hypothetical protein